MRQYECTYLISDEVPENDLNKVTGKVASFVTEMEGKVEKEDIWGRRKLAYPIKKQDFATYVTLFFSLPADKMMELDRNLRHTNAILRHLLIVTDSGTTDLSLTADEIAETAEIEKAVGGEKSFEAVIGETEKSKSLMQKRATQETESQSDTETEIEEEVENGEQPEITEEETIEEPATEETPVKEEKVEKPAEEKKPKAAKKKESKSGDEAERLSKLNEELDDILKDEL